MGGEVEKDVPLGLGYFQGGVGGLSDGGITVRLFSGEIYAAEMLLHGL